MDAGQLFVFPAGSEGCPGAPSVSDLTLQAGFRCQETRWGLGKVRDSARGCDCCQPWSASGRAVPHSSSFSHPSDVWSCSEMWQTPAYGGGNGGGEGVLGLGVLLGLSTWGLGRTG